MGGGNGSGSGFGWTYLGLSPRGRGKPSGALPGRSNPASIPAWAGETHSAGSRLSAGDGLSPRGRGKPAGRRRRPDFPRSIPAWAGETSPAAGYKSRWLVYPRVGGGNRATASPSVRRTGLSPRGRGKRIDGVTDSVKRRSIPAWAGETIYLSRLTAGTKVYPRVGGGNGIRPACRPSLRGLSPRGRGKRQLCHSPAILPRSIPAWAGETHRTPPPPPQCPVYPRVGGGNCGFHSAGGPEKGLSPRGRGKPRDIPKLRQGFRSIPAWAGETPAAPLPKQPPEVYPRVGGGNGHRRQSAAALTGLSPRGRGKLGLPGRPYQPNRSIPAWAGETVSHERETHPPEVYPRVGGGN